MKWDERVEKRKVKDIKQYLAFRQKMCPSYFKKVPIAGSKDKNKLKNEITLCGQHKLCKRTKKYFTKK